MMSSASPKKVARHPPSVETPKAAGNSEEDDEERQDSPNSSRYRCKNCKKGTCASPRPGGFSGTRDRADAVIRHDSSYNSFSDFSNASMGDFSNDGCPSTPESFAGTRTTDIYLYRLT